MAHSRLVAMASAETVAACSTALPALALEEGARAHLGPITPEDSSASTRAPRHTCRSGSDKHLQAIGKTVSKLLITLDAWSRQQATQAEVSDVFVKLGTECQLVCRAFTAAGVDTSDLGNVPDELRTILKAILGEDANLQTLNTYMPKIRKIIIFLLHGLRDKQVVLRENKATTDTTLSKPVREEGAPADLTHHFNEVSRARTPNEMKGLYKYFMVPGMTNLAGGLPFPGYFPFDTLESSVSKPTRYVPPIAADFHGLHPTSSSTPSTLRSLFSFGSKPPPTPEASKSSTHISIPKFSPHTTPPEARVDVSTALQYSLVTGMYPLTSFVKNFALNHLHGGRIPYKNPGPDILLTCGNTDGLGKAISLLASRGDNLLVEQFTYPNSIQTATPYGVGIVPITMDPEGILTTGPGGLRDILENWNPKEQGRLPHILYTVTIGQNPTGGSLSLQRRKEIYELCEKFDIIIIEDDPYWYLQFTPSSHPDPTVPPREGKYPFLEAMTPSFLTIDVSGRVIRLDTFSKTIAPGCRLGWITAQPEFIERITRISESSTLAPSGFSQAMVAQLLSVWGMDGWVRWLEGLRGVYEARMLNMCAALEKHVETVVTSGDEEEVVVEKVRMYEFEKPMGGMFVWVNVHIMRHPAYKEYTGVRGHTKLEMMMQLWGYVAETQLSLPAPGWVFAASEEIKEDEAAVKLRFCFAAIEEDGVAEATERWGRGVEAFWGLDADEIEEWGEGKGKRVVGEMVSLGWAGGVVGGGC